MFYTLFSLSIAATIPDKLVGDGLLYHSIEFVAGILRQPSAFPPFWHRNDLYMTSFSYVNSNKPEIAGRSGILVDPKHPDVTVHTMLDHNGGFNGTCKSSHTGTINGACQPGSAQFDAETRTMDCVSNQRWPKVNKCYQSHMASRPRDGFVDKSNLIPSLKQYCGYPLNWSEVVASVPFRAILGVVEWDHKDVSNPKGEELCKAMRNIKPNCPCYKTRKNAGGNYVLEGVLGTPTLPSGGAPVPPTPAPAPVPPTPSPAPVFRPPTPPTSIPRFEQRIDSATCSEKCGGGVRTSTVVCVDSHSGSFVDDAKCFAFGLVAPPTYTEECNTHACRSSQAWLIILIVFIAIGTAVTGYLGIKRFQKQNEKLKVYPIVAMPDEIDDTKLDVASRSFSKSLSGSLTLRKRRSLTSMSFEDH